MIQELRTVVDEVPDLDEAKAWSAPVPGIIENLHYSAAKVR